MSLQRSPLAPQVFENPELPLGLRLGVSPTGMKYKGRDDFALFHFVGGANVAGRFTTSETAGPPVRWCRKVVQTGRVSAIAVNAGVANAFTGAAGEKVVQETAALVAQHLSCPAEEVLVASTGVIGEPPDLKLLRLGIADASDRMSEESANWLQAAGAILTTDTFPKTTSQSIVIEGRKVSICGMVKGSGMIAPNMATMLAYIVTDAAVRSEDLDLILGNAVETSFNCITVDSDTSTSDTVILAATGDTLGGDVLSGVGLDLFASAVNEVCKDLALQVVRDGEGASKLIEVVVSGAATQEGAKRVGLAIANSPLVKTAIAGEDANWGRIVMAAGKAGVPFDQSKLSIWIGEVRIARDGSVDPSYTEGDCTAHLRGSEIEIRLDLGLVNGEKATCWTCDLNHGYIDINVDYRS